MNQKPIKGVNQKQEIKNEKIKTRKIIKLDNEKTENKKITDYIKEKIKTDNLILISLLSKLNIQNLEIIKNGKNTISYLIELYEDKNRILVSNRFEEKILKEYIESKKDITKFIRELNPELNKLYKSSIKISNNIYLLNKFNFLESCLIKRDKITEKNKLIPILVKNKNLYYNGYILYITNTKDIYIIFENNNIKKEIIIINRYINNYINKSILNKKHKCNFKGVLNYNLHIKMDKSIKQYINILYLINEICNYNVKVKDILKNKDYKNIEKNIKILISKLK